MSITHFKLKSPFLQGEQEPQSSSSTPASAQRGVLPNSMAINLLCSVPVRYLFVSAQPQGPSKPKRLFLRFPGKSRAAKGQVFLLPLLLLSSIICIPLKCLFYFQLSQALLSSPLPGRDFVLLFGDHFRKVLSCGRRPECEAVSQLNSHSTYAVTLRQLYRANSWCLR